MAKKITLYFDIVSPFAYIAFSVLQVRLLFLLLSCGLIGKFLEQIPTTEEYYSPVLSVADELGL
jgi:hypothetical protein